MIVCFQISTFDEKDRLCCLTLDEMAITSRIEYDPSCKSVLGDATLGPAVLATHALVFMLGGEFWTYNIIFRPPLPAIII